mmetsp:Transcript_23843/g.40580  ORF Transcript_23843/g.40580 Transcript_23843/m.40580 type:complete len:240 (-) Transcript_23843:13-732(-)|eukprot:CAMPEP_0114436184 /NCGR_PEP_ID=MMETSP0103-20121206/13293_1 /TAXON_ID=37642 ORGANISM="Paraphysomonas imperforata, Strain PA2" /NCGR_SAMPLE_ID=MMETSP0103 /ASSEMBLY_ACC=CAM_ASM_000201 /LENGTH=239 /DNA_ID=CAMNT_0001606389 /DNA_START=44 /DNA_END=763 /DNA_ORIENTATION=-
MLRRPSKDPATRRTLSYTDVDLENNSSHSTSSHEYNINSTSISFKLMSLLKKQWQNFSDTNFAICQESTDFVIAHKPEFDQEKLKLIRLGSFLETDVLCGTVTAIKTRKKYDGPKLSENTFSPEWNQDARNINELIKSLNREINRENLIMHGDDIPLASPSSSSVPVSTSPPLSESPFMSQFSSSSDEMIQMKVMTQESFDRFKRNPQIVLQSPMHAAVACVMVFAVIGLFSTLGAIFF